MNSFSGQFVYSVIVGAAGFAALLLPALIVQYRRYGRLSPARLLGTAAACIYGTALIVFTMFPLPTVAEACHGRTGPKLQSIPLHFLADLRHQAAKTSWPAALHSFVVMQVALNVALFVPLGMLLRRFAGRSTGVSILLGFAVSLAIEATQYTGIWGIYPCGYRVADVDDLIANTAGAALGALLAPVVLGWMPQARQLEHLAPAPVSAARRWLGMIADWLSIGLVAACLELAGLLLRALLAAPHTADAEVTASAHLTGPEHAGAAAIAALFVLYVPSLLGSGGTLGQRIVRIRPVWADAAGATIPRRFARTSVVGGAYASGLVVPPLLEAARVPLLPGLYELLIDLIVLVAVVWVAFGSHAGLSGAVTGARMVDVRVREPRLAPGQRSPQLHR